MRRETKLGPGFRARKHVLDSVQVACLLVCDETKMLGFEPIYRIPVDLEMRAVSVYETALETPPELNGKLVYTATPDAPWLE